MKKFKVTFKHGHESYNGYDLYDIRDYFVEARNHKSAENKAKKLLPKYGWIQYTIIEEIKDESVSDNT
jgi:hypothetical protein